ncbi:MAG: ABC transporter permease subunit, partial [Micromonosporaceae bacterium]|nr:ABC transporter permease subunit [Micromonosporaceae bacterium]
MTVPTKDSVPSAPEPLAGPKVSAARSWWRPRLSRRFSWLVYGLGGLTVAVVYFAPPLLPAVGLDPVEGELDRRFAEPSPGGFLFGGDQLGRDVLARVLEGGQHTFTIALAASAIAGVLGVALGLFGASMAHRPVLGRMVTRLVDFSIAFPNLVLVMVIIGLLGRSNMVLAVSLGLFFWPVVARVVYAEGRRVLTQDYVVAARLFGVSQVRLMLRHVLPNLASVIAVVCAFQFADLLIAAAALSFLGLGPPIGVPEWG